MIMFLMTMSMTLSFMFIALNHPMSFGGILILQTITISLITGMINYNFWFSYILFLIMVGGMLILFIYMTSVASDEKFKFSIKMMIFFTMMFLSFISFMMSNLPHLSMNNKILKLSDSARDMGVELSMNKMLNLPSNILFIMLMIYLFITMIAIVKITNIKSGPLRQKF